MRSECIGKGGRCPKCLKLMGRYKHPDGWKPKVTQPFYFSFWDKCVPCRYLQHYEEAKVFLSGVNNGRAWETNFSGDKDHSRKE